MATLRAPGYKLTVNDQFDVSATVAPYLISIVLEDTFDTDFSVSKLEIVFHAKYKRSVNWQYKDKLKLELFWQTDTTKRFVSNTFYVDHITGIEDAGGMQTFRVSALEADPNLGYNYGINQVSLTNKTQKQAITDFKNTFGLTVIDNLSEDVYIGDISNSATDLNTVTANFNSYAEMLKYICKKNGYFGNISGKTLTLIRVNSYYTPDTRFLLPSIENILSMDATQTYNAINKEYRALYVNRSNSNAITELVLQPTAQAQLNNKVKRLESDSYYYNYQSGYERVFGELYLDFLSGFETRIKTMGMPEYTGGNIFLLDASYGSKEGYYRCTKAVHNISASGWTTDITGFPIKAIDAYQAWFYTGYLGRNNNPSATLGITQNLAGTITITAASLNNFARLYNPNYSEVYLELGIDLGALYLQEANKAANGIRLDVAFCQMLVETTNLTDLNRKNLQNPGGIAGDGGVGYASFSSWTNGVRAHIQHLFAFAKSTGSPADTIVDPRYSNVTRGSATTIDMLQNRWNADTDYSYRIKSKLVQLHQFLNPNSQVNFTN